MSCFRQKKARGSGCRQHPEPGNPILLRNIYVSALMCSIEKKINVVTQILLLKNLLIPFVVFIIHLFVIE